MVFANRMELQLREYHDVYLYGFAFKRSADLCFCWSYIYAWFVKDSEIYKCDNASQMGGGDLVVYRAFIWVIEMRQIGDFYAGA